MIGEDQVTTAGKIVSSARLELRFFCREDVEPIFNGYTSDLNSARYLARKPHVEIKQTERMLQRLSRPESLACFGMCTWVIYSYVERTAVGLITTEKSDAEVILHFGVGPAFRGHGYAVEALTAAARYWRDKEPTLTISSYTDTENVAAKAVLELSGFVCTGHVSKVYKAPQLQGEHRDLSSYIFGRRCGESG
jgi:ribosomal-protein-alanine N-acetyltransferase